MKRTKHVAGLLALILTLSVGMPGFAFADTAKNASGKQFRVVGYYSGALFNEPVEKLQTDKLTHVIYSFLIPKEDGGLVELEKPDQLKALVKQAHEDGAKVFIALGGWSYQNKPLVTVFETLAASKEKRTLLIENVRALVREYDLDGLELDWEHPSEKTIANYEKLVVELKDALSRDGKELTAALNGAWSTTAGPEVSKLMTDKCLNSFSFINVMAYDMNNQEHSPLWFADTSINYWLNRGVAADKIVLGMPLYARPSWKQYRDLIAENPEYAYRDYAATSPQDSYYNGINTMREKTVIALKKAGGVMLFDVNEDTSDSTSAVSMIDDLVKRTNTLSGNDLKGYVTVILDNHELKFLKEEGYGTPFIDGSSRTLIPLRKPLEAIGATVDYDEVSRVVTASRNGTTVKIPVGESFIEVNGSRVAMDTRAVIKDSRTYIPLRAVFSAFGYDVNWHDSSKTVYLTKSASAPSQDIKEFTPYNINGGTTGIFSRKQLAFTGFDGIEADVTLPRVSLGQKGDCPYVYFGFDWQNDSGNAEGGFQFIEDENNPGYNKWTVFLRQGNDWRWGNNILLEQGSEHHLKFYSEKLSDQQTDLVIELDGKEIIRKASAATDFTKVSVKAVTAMAMSKPFDGTNCPSKSENSKISNMKVSEINSDQYKSFSDYQLYSEWRANSKGGIWFGTADCIPSYLHFGADGSVSIYN